jgi:hypothetical protein
MKQYNLKKILLYTVYISLLIQLLTGIFDIYVLYSKSSTENILLWKLLLIEILVQVVEGIFYIWLANSFSSITNVTPNRYFDWVITTPTMLFTTIAYYEYLRIKKNNKNILQNEYYTNIFNKKSKIIEKSNDNEYTSEEESINVLDEESKTIKESMQNEPEKLPTTVREIFNKHKKIIFIVLGLNLLMLLFGYLGEMKIIPIYMSVLLGFIPFFIYIIIIYNKFAKFTLQGQIIFWIFSSIWALYGISALFSYYWKNILYNILDIIAKNFFGIFLGYILYTNKS